MKQLILIIIALALASASALSASAKVDVSYSDNINIEVMVNGETTEYNENLAIQGNGIGEKEIQFENVKINESWTKDLFKYNKTIQWINGTQQIISVPLRRDA